MRQEGNQRTSKPHIRKAKQNEFLHQFPSLGLGTNGRERIRCAKENLSLFTQEATLICDMGVPWYFAVGNRMKSRVLNVQCSGRVMLTFLWRLESWWQVGCQVSDSGLDHNVMCYLGVLTLYRVSTCYWFTREHACSFSFLTSTRDLEKCSFVCVRRTKNSCKMNKVSATINLHGKNIWLYRSTHMHCTHLRKPCAVHSFFTWTYQTDFALVSFQHWYHAWSSGYFTDQSGQDDNERVTDSKKSETWCFAFCDLCRSTAVRTKVKRRQGELPPFRV